MFDIGFLCPDYCDSKLKISDDNCKDLEQLSNRLRASEIALEFHTKELNPKQAAFFRESVENLREKIEGLNAKLEYAEKQIYI